MPIIESSSELARSMQGLHLYHAGMSNCSQRVRVVLEEKALTWESHLIDLAANEQLAPEYQKINPKGVVPVLVHDGQVVIESNDIIAYVEENLPGVPLAGQEEHKPALIKALLEKSTALQGSIKLLTFTLAFGDRYKKSPEQLEEYASRQGNKELVEWHRKFSQNEFTEADMQAAVDEFAGCLAELDQTLREDVWLSGGKFGLADVSWMVNVDRAHLLERFSPELLGIGQHPALGEWFDGIRRRPSYSNAITAYLPS